MGWSEDFLNTKAAPREKKQREKKTKKPPTQKEWRLQAACVKDVRAMMKLDKNLWYEVNLVEGQRDVVRASVAKSMGMQKGPNDLTLYRRKLIDGRWKLLTHRIEFKLPKKELTEEQVSWFNFHRSCDIPCDRVDNQKDFRRIFDHFMVL